MRRAGGDAWHSGLHEVPGDSPGRAPVASFEASPSLHRSEAGGNLDSLRRDKVCGSRHLWRASDPRGRLGRVCFQAIRAETRSGRHAVGGRNCICHPGRARAGVQPPLGRGTYGSRYKAVVAAEGPVRWPRRRKPGVLARGRLDMLLAHPAPWQEAW